MSLNDLLQISSYVGGVGFIIVIISVLASFFVKIWMKKYVETRFDMIKEKTSRYSGQQFELYNKFWHFLYDLKITADLLWEEANDLNLRQFSKQLKTTIDGLEKSYLFIEETHYQELKKLLKEFSDYQFGKKKLIELYRQKANEQIDYQLVQQLISHNRGKKQNYEDLLDRIRKDLKKQIS